MLILSIDLRKIDQSKCKSHSNGAKYCELVVMERRDGEDQWGNTHLVVQGVSKEERQAGVKGPILGNGKETGQRPASQPRQHPSAPSGDYPRQPRPSQRSAPKSPDPDLDAPEDDVPF